MKKAIICVLLLLIMLTNFVLSQSVSHAQEIQNCASSNEVVGIGMSPNEEYVVGIWWKFVQVWETRTGKLVNEFKTDSETGIDSAVFSPDDRYILVGDGLKAVLWDVKSGKQIREFPNTNKYPTFYSAYFSDDGKWVLATSTINLDIWDAKTGKKLANFDQAGIDSAFIGSDLSANKSYLVLDSFTGQMELWDMTKVKLLRVLEQGTARLSPDEQFILQKTFDGYLVLRKRTNNAIVWSILYDTNQTEGRGDPGLFSPDGKYIVARTNHWSGDHVTYTSIHLWDARTGQELYEFGSNELSLENGFFLSDSKYLVTPGSAYWGLYLWDIVTKKIVRRIDNVQMRDFAVSNDGKYVVMLIYDDPTFSYHFKLFDFETGKEIRTYC